jgi:hypothetical protein
MNIPLTHATVQGLDYIRRGQGLVVANERLPMWVRACDGKKDVINTVTASSIPSTIPTCPKCAVMRDAALEGRGMTT